MHSVTVTLCRVLRGVIHRACLQLQILPCCECNRGCGIRFNNMNLAPGFKSPDASKLEYQHYVKYVEEKFPSETPQMFWLHPNAEIGYLTNQGLNVFSTIMKVSGGSGGGGGGDLNAATEYINTYSALLPADLDMSRRLTGGFAEALRAQSLHST